MNMTICAGSPGIQMFYGIYVRLKVSSTAVVIKFFMFIEAVFDCILDTCALTFQRFSLFSIEIKILDIE